MEVLLAIHGVLFVAIAAWSVWIGRDLVSRLL